MSIIYPRPGHTPHHEPAPPPEPSPAERRIAELESELDRERLRIAALRARLVEESGAHFIDADDQLLVGPLGTFRHRCRAAEGAAFVDRMRQGRPDDTTTEAPPAPHDARPSPDPPQGRTEDDLTP